jgi:hypothetical protein
MRHIAITTFSGESCHGEIVKEMIPREEPARRLSLPVYPSVGLATKPPVRWRCLSCNKVWDREPLPQEAL